MDHTGSAAAAAGEWADDFEATIWHGGGEGERPVAYDEKTADRVRAALKGRRAVAERRLMGHLAFLVNGAMCCSVGPESVLFRIDPDDRERLLTRPGVTAMTMGSRTMTGFVRVAPQAYRTEAALAKWIEGGIAAGGGATAAAAGAGSARKARPSASTRRPAARR